MSISRYAHQDYLSKTSQVVGMLGTLRAQSAFPVLLDDAPPAFENMITADFPILRFDEFSFLGSMEQLRAFPFLDAAILEHRDLRAWLDAAACA